MFTSRNLIILLVVAMIASLSVSLASAQSSTPLNVNVSQRLGNESEEAVAVNPTNPNNIVIFTNIAEGVNGMFLATSFDGVRPGVNGSSAKAMMSSVIPVAIPACRSMSTGISS